MLVFTRKSGQKFRIGDNITVSLLFDKGQIKVGIDAPKGMVVLRDELYIQADSNLKPKP